MGFEVETLELGGEGAEGIDTWLEGAGAVVDSIFGTGFAGVPRAPADAVIEAINRCGAPVVAQGAADSLLQISASGMGEPHAATSFSRIPRSTTASTARALTGGSRR
jgi:NAD(P)H-hydrate repair Nnr-like enzyme with NAD(P)H-hydrate epimerase domain